MYCSFCISLFSHDICVKNFTISSLVMALFKTGIFCSGGRYAPTNVHSKRSRKAESIFRPRPSRSVRGKL